MTLSVAKGTKFPRRGLRGARRWTLAGSALLSASCVPVAMSQVPAAPTPAPPPVAADTATPAERATPAIAMPVPQPARARLAYEGRTELDRLRSLDCLAQAIYYEAASESESGQRAVAQVVLNRVRHPAWPDSICGVVYQGPMRPGGGCQFTFTCDGSLAVRPSAAGWARARILAAEALAGYVHAPVGLSTHYHTHAVSPAWAPRLRRTTVIGAHNFYRLPGTWGEAAAFTDAYTGVEPFPRPAMTLLRRPVRTAGLDALTTATQATHWSGSDVSVPAAVSAPAPDPAEAMIREEYRNSGQWRTDAPEAIAGR